ncbi:MAG: PD40 domain-containing protein [Bacteroidetes bacterium]|nr:PD40 domain-containing protein [Bacteroidota bacterium]
MFLKKTILPAFLMISIISVSFIQDEPVTEKHLKNIKQLTFGGDNAEAYFSFNNKMITFQKTNPAEEIPCDQIFTMDITDQNKDLKVFPVSNGEGKTTCSYFMPGNKKIIFASTHSSIKECPKQPTPPEWAAHKYLWAIHNEFDIYVSSVNGNDMKVLTASAGYDAEATVSPKGDKIIFTSTRNGDLDLYIMDIDGKNVKQLTNTLGYDGGAFFSPDGKKLVYRASRPQTEKDIKEYRELLAIGLVAPTNMEIYTMNIDGSDQKQITKLGKANWAPFYHPAGKKIIFSSNHQSTPESRGYNFQLYMVNEDGTGLEQITTESKFNAFPMFSFDGKKLIFSSNRNNNGTKDTNLFIADWVE